MFLRAGGPHNDDHRRRRRRHRRRRHLGSRKVIKKGSSRVMMMRMIPVVFEDIVGWLVPVVDWIEVLSALQGQAEDVDTEFLDMRIP